MLRPLLPLLAWLLMQPVLAQQRELSVCDDANEWPPYTYYRPDAGPGGPQLTGFTVELLRLIAARRGLLLRIEMLPWKRCLEAVRHGEILGLLNAISTPERERDYLLSSVIYETRLLYLWSKRQRPEGLKLRSQSELAALRTGGVHGYSYSQLDAAEQARIVRAPNYGSLMQMLHLGRVDVALVNEGVMLGHALLGKREFGNEAELGYAPLEDRQPSRFYLMFTRARPEGAAMQALVNAELALLARTGELAKLRAQFLRGG